MPSPAQAAGRLTRDRLHKRWLEAAQLLLEAARAGAFGNREACVRTAGHRHLRYRHRNTKLNPTVVGIAAWETAGVAAADDQRSSAPSVARSATDAAPPASGPGERGSDPASAIARVRLRAPS